MKLKRILCFLMFHSNYYAGTAAIFSASYCISSVLAPERQLGIPLYFVANFPLFNEV